MHSPIEESLLDRLQRLDDAGERRTLETNRLPQGVDIDIDGQRCTNFCSNDYLGFASHPRICEALKEGVDRYGVGAGAAALLSGRCEAHVALENAIAAYLGRQRALIFSSGYMANLAFASALISRDDVIFHDRLNHASLIDSVRLSGATHRRYPHKDIKALELMLSQATKKRRWIITDALFSMDGDLAPLSALADLAEAYQATLIVDDAHGFGCLGDGRGSAEALGVAAARLPILMVTFGKALGTAGAAIVANEIIIDSLIQRARTFIYDTAMSPALAFATNAALTLLQKEPEIRTRLFANIARFKRLASAASVALQPSDTPIQIIPIGDSNVAVTYAQSLRKQGLYVRAIRPPTVPKDTARLRVTITAAHSDGQIDHLVDALQRLPRCH